MHEEQGAQTTDQAEDPNIAGEVLKQDIKIFDDEWEKLQASAKAAKEVEEQREREEQQRIECDGLDLGDLRSELSIYDDIFSALVVALAPSIGHSRRQEDIDDIVGHAHTIADSAVVQRRVWHTSMKQNFFLQHPKIAPEHVIAHYLGSGGDGDEGDEGTSQAIGDPDSSPQG